MVVSILLLAVFMGLFDVFHGNKNMFGLTLLFLGSLPIGLVFVIREKWRVTCPIENLSKESE